MYNIIRIHKFNVVCVLQSYTTKIVFDCSDLECQRCPIDGIGVLVYHVMADC
jgi:hypothetical protein